MKKKMFLLLGIFLILSSCGKLRLDSDRMNAHNDFNHFLSLADETEGQFYFVQYMSMMRGDRMMYLDNSRMISYPLCGKAECPHEDTDPDCNARLPGTAIGMAACEDALYVCVMSEGASCTYDVFRMNTDGTKQQKVRTLTSTEPTRSSDFPRNNTRLMFHRGHVYATGQKAVLSDGEWSFYNIIIDYDLNSDQEGEILYESIVDTTNARGFVVRPVGSFLYYVKSDLIQEDGEKAYNLEIGEINIETGNIGRVYDGDSDFSAFEFQTDGNRFVFTSPRDGRVREFNRETGQFRELTDFSSDGEPFRMMSIANNRVIGLIFPETDSVHIRIRDFEGNNLYDVKRARAEFEFGGRTFCGIDDQYLYCDYVYGGEDVEAKECLVAYPLDSEQYYIVWQSR